MTPGGEATPGDDAQHPGSAGQSQGAPSQGAPVPGEAADDPLLTPSEVAEMFRVNPKTVTRWARTGRLQAIKTIGGHRRYRLSEVRKAVEAANATD
jgi:excisionase family DNA binding protein